MSVSGPLKGIRVLDLTTAWAGPMTTRLLAGLGADVIKIESPTRLDDWRGVVQGAHPTRYPDLTPGERPYNRNIQFNTQNHDKRSLSLNLKDPRGLEAFLQLVPQADVVVANFRPGKLDKLGIGYQALQLHNDQIIVVEMPAYGAGGPFSDHIALGPLMEFMSGMSSLIGYGDGKPLTTGPAYLDPMGGFNGAAAVLTALHYRRKIGHGCAVEVAQREAAMHWIGEELIWSQMTGETRVPRGNGQTSVAPHDAFPTAGEDDWIAIACETDSEFASLCHELHLDDLTSDVRFVSVTGRLNHEDELNAMIAQETRNYEKNELAEHLQLAGVHAAPVCTGRDLAASDFLKARGMLHEINHPEAGTHVYQGLPLHIEGFELGIGAPAPLFGQHTREVLRDVVGLNPAEIDELWAAGVIDDVPR